MRTTWHAHAATGAGPRPCWTSSDMTTMNWASARMTSSRCVGPGEQAPLGCPTASLFLSHPPGRGCSHMAAGTGPGQPKLCFLPFSANRPTVQIISQKDEHCWVGELNGLRGEASVWRRGRLGSETGSLGHPPRALWPQQELGFLSQQACPRTALTGWEVWGRWPAAPHRALLLPQAGFQPSLWKSWMKGVKR